MTIFINNIKRMIRDKGFILMLLCPFMFIIFIMKDMAFIGLNAAIIDNDKTPLTNLFVNVMEAKCTLSDINEGDITKKLLDGDIDYAVVIDKGFTKKIINEENAKIKGYKIKETNASVPLSISMDSFISSVKTIAKSSNKDEKTFYTALEYFKNGGLKIQHKSLGNPKKVNTYASLGFLVMGMLIFSSNSSILILKDKEKKTFYRTFAAPISVKNYMLQNILSFLIVSILQVLIVITVMIKFFNADFGPNLNSIIILFFIFSLVAVSFGIMISSLAKNSRQAGALSSLFITPMCMLGGCFWDRNMMNEVLQKLSNFVPTTWILKGVENAFFATSLGSAKTEFLILLLFAVVFFLIGSFKKADIEK